MLDNAMIALLGTSIWETLYMVIVSMILSYAIGIPIGVILTIAAAGSEMSDSSVITNENGWLKRGYSSDYGENDNQQSACKNQKHRYTPFLESYSTKELLMI